MPATLTIGALDLDEGLVGRLAAVYDVIAWRHGRTTPVASACAAPIVVSAFSDDATLRSVVEGSDGLLASIRDGAIHVACGLHGRAAIDHVCGEHERRGQRFVAAPILLAAGTGQEAAAIVGGASDAVERVRSVLDAIGVSIAAVCERPADAALLAAAHSAMLASAMEAISEAFALVRKYGVDPAVMRDVMADALFAGSVYPRLADAMLGGADGNAPSAARGLQVVDLAFDAANTAHVPLPGLDACRDRLVSAIASGNGAHAWTVVAQEVARASGLDSSRR